MTSTFLNSNREYVWTREQAKQLLVSLLRGYPTGSVLFWKTDDPPDIKNNAVARERIGTTSVILDGQQRLTTLYQPTRWIIAAGNPGVVDHAVLRPGDEVRLEPQGRAR